MVAFPSARRAVQCARAIQRAIASQLRDPAGGPIRLRIGLHTGEAIREEADFYGKNIVLAARIADQACGGEILASSVVKQLTESAGDLRFENEGELGVDGLAGTHRSCCCARATCSPRCRNPASALSWYPWDSCAMRA